jgi:thiamine kinase
MEKGARIAQGRTAEIYAWADGQVLKLFREGYSAEVSAHEASIANMIFAAGAPCPTIGELVHTDGRFGVVYERIDGPSLESQLRSQPWRIAAIAYQLAEIQVAVQACAVPGLPTVRERLGWQIQHAAPLTLARRDAAQRALDRLPDGDALCHGDFHLGNVLLSHRGPLVIDWENASHGHLLGDVARTLLLLRMGWVYPRSATQRSLLRGVISMLVGFYLRRYRQLRPFPGAELRAWQLPVAAARLSESITEEEPHLLKLVTRLAERTGDNGHD